MKRQVTFFVFLFLAAALLRPASALNPSSLGIQKSISDQIKILPCTILGTCPTAAPTAAPTATPKPEPTATVIIITETPAADEEMLIDEGLPPEETEVLGTTSAPSPSVTPKVSPTVTLTPTPTPKPGGMTTREMALAGGLGVLLLLILAQNWPKIKTFLHEKTK